MFDNSDTGRHHEAERGYKKKKLAGKTYAVVADELFDAVADGEVHRDAVPVFAILWKYTSDESGEAWPKYKTIAEKLCMSSRQVMRIVKRLVQLGFVDRRHRKNRDNSHTSNAYVVHFSRASRNRGDCESGGVVTVSQTIKKDLYKKPSLNSTVTKTGASVEAGRERDLGEERNDGPFDEPSSQPGSGSSLFEETKAGEAVVERVCRRIQSQRVKMGEPKPKITEKWESDTRRLLANGSPEWDEKEPISGEEVESLLVWALNDKFWPSRIPNPAAFSRNWTSIKRAFKKAAQPAGAVLDVRGSDSPTIDLTGAQAGYTPVRPELQERTPFNLDPAAVTTDPAAAKSRIADMRDKLGAS